MKNYTMVGLTLESVWMTPLTEVHPAWADESSAPSTAFVNFVFDAAPGIAVVPCEVEVPDAHPSLGIEFGNIDLVSEFPRKWLRPSPDALVQIEDIQRYLPAKIVKMHLWDSLGEGPKSALKIVTTSGLALTVRHQYPPMTLGVEIAWSNSI